MKKVIELLRKSIFLAVCLCVPSGVVKSIEEGAQSFSFRMRTESYRNTAQQNAQTTSHGQESAIVIQPAVIQSLQQAHHPDEAQTFIKKCAPFMRRCCLTTGKAVVGSLIEVVALKITTGQLAPQISDAFMLGATIAKNLAQGFSTGPSVERGLDMRQHIKQVIKSQLDYALIELQLTQRDLEGLSPEQIAARVQAAAVVLEFVFDHALKLLPSHCADLTREKILFVRHVAEEIVREEKISFTLVRVGESFFNKLLENLPA